MGLLRWASIKPVDLIRAIDDDFRLIADPACYQLSEPTDGDWGFTHTGYGIRIDHSGLKRAVHSREAAAAQIFKATNFNRRLMLEHLADGEKIFVYRTFDHVLPADLLADMARAIRRHGPGKLLYVQLADAEHSAFTVRPAGDNLLHGYIDAFAPQDHKLVYNNRGWERICRAALQAAESCAVSSE